MLNDTYDKIIFALLALTLVALVVLLSGSGAGAGAGKNSADLDKAVQREMVYQARMTFLKKLYDPVESLRRSGKLQAALFKLEEIARRYPNESYGHILRGEILFRMGALEEALENFVAAVKLNGDYLDRDSPLSRRAEIQEAEEKGLKVIAGRARSHPDNPSLAAALNNVNYLRSRLAGGCE